MSDSAFQIEIAIRTRMIAHAALGITGSIPRLALFEVAELRSRLDELEAALKKGVKS